MTTHALEASPRKLKSGEWGAAIQNPPDDLTSGQSIHIKTKSGKEWDAIVTQVVFRGDDFALVATRSSGGGTVRRNGNGRGRSQGRLVGYHTDNHCSCGNWSGVGSPCLYTYGEAKNEDEHRFIDWRRE